MTDRVITNALTIDWEDWYQGLEIPQAEWDGYEDRLERATHRVLEAFSAAKVRATFFVLGHAAERHPELVRAIAGAGHEIGTHGWSHTFVYRQEPAVFRAEVERSLRLLETLAGRPVLGHRAPFFSITKRSLWALDILGELGIAYDSSIYPVANYRYGIEDAPRWPHEIPGPAATLREFPITTWRVLGRNLPIAGGAYFRIYPYALTRAGFRAVNAEGRPAVFYLHPWELDPDHPRIPIAKRIALTHYANLKGTEGRLRRLLGDFRFAPMGEVLGVG